VDGLLVVGLLFLLVICFGWWVGTNYQLPKTRQKRVVSRPKVGSRTIPQDVKIAVTLRDEGKCQWPVESGGTCGSTHQVERDHRLSQAVATCRGPAGRRGTGCSAQVPLLSKVRRTKRG
jgi:hypothetical protein